MIKRFNHIKNFFYYHYQKWQNFFSITKLGVTLILINLWVFAFYVIKESDIVLTVLSVTFFIILILLKLGICWYRRQLKKNCEINLWINNNYVRAQESINVIFELKRFKIAPFFYFSWRPVTQVNLPKIGLWGRVHSIDTTYHQSFIFPHRGIWEISLLECELKDIFGLLAVSWKKPLLEPISLKVEPETFEATTNTLAVLSETIGTDIPSLKASMGDYYDLKPYEYTDGTNRIIWKMFARNRVLVSRKPDLEESLDGELLVFVEATKKDDRVARLSLSYLEYFAKHGIKFHFNCLGGEISKNVTSANEALNLLISSVWNSTNEKGEDSFANYLKMISKLPIKLFGKRLLLFVQVDNYRDEDLLFKRLDNYSKIASNYSISVSLVVLVDNATNTIFIQQSKIMKLFFDLPIESTNPEKLKIILPLLQDFCDNGKCNIIWHKC
jgi:uncharacterized protein (DUF58 family)